MHEDRTRMEIDQHLQEPDPYTGEMGDTGQFRYRSEWEIEEWVYEQAYENESVNQLWEYFGESEFAELGREYLMEGPECAKHWISEQINESIRVITREQLSNYVDGQMRLYAGYDVAENGDTLQEGDYSKWQDLRMMWEAGVYDKLRGNDKYYSLP